MNYQIVNYHTNQVLYSNPKSIKNVQEYLHSIIPWYLPDAIYIRNVETEPGLTRITICTLHDEISQQYFTISNKIILVKYNENLYSELKKKYPQLTLNSYNTTIANIIHFYDPLCEFSVVTDFEMHPTQIEKQVKYSKNNVVITNLNRDCAITKVFESVLYAKDQNSVLLPKTDQIIYDKIVFTFPQYSIVNKKQLIENTRNMLQQFVTDYKLFEKGIEILTFENIRFIIHYSKKLEIVFYKIPFNTYTQYLLVLNLLLKNCLKINPVLENTNTKDCQKNRRPEYYQGILHDTEAEKNTFYMSTLKSLKCTNPEYPFPGLTKQGTPCCFKMPTDNEFHLFDIKGTFEPCEPLTLTKETLSNQLRTNIYIINLETKEYFDSDYMYDIYTQSQFYAYHPTLNSWWKSDEIDTNNEVKLKVPTYTGIKYLKEYLKTIKKFIQAQIVDIFNNVIYLKIHDAYIPVVPQPYIPDIPIEQITARDSQVQIKVLKLFKIDYTVISNDFIRINNLGLIIPISHHATIEILDLNQQLYNKKQIEMK